MSYGGRTGNVLGEFLFSFVKMGCIQPRYIQPAIVNPAIELYKVVCFDG